MRPRIRFLAGAPGELYRPTSGDEGRAFDAMWCDCCQKDAKYRITCQGEDGCPIIANTMAYEEDDPEYPKAWAYGDDGQPKCLEFQKELPLEDPT